MLLFILTLKYVLVIINRSSIIRWRSNRTKGKAKLAVGAVEQQDGRRQQRIQEPSLGCGNWGAGVRGEEGEDPQAPHIPVLLT